MGDRYQGRRRLRAVLPDDRRYRSQRRQALRHAAGEHRRHLPRPAPPEARPPADNQTVRNVFIIGPDKKIKLVLVYPMTTGRNFDEVLRVIDSLQLTAKYKVATPVNWKQGEDVVIAGSVNNEQAKELFGEWREPKPYIRIVPQPEGAQARASGT